MLEPNSLYDQPGHTDCKLLSLEIFIPETADADIKEEGNILPSLVQKSKY